MLNPVIFLKNKISLRVAKLIPDTNLIVITGSVGKSTTLLSCQEVLSEKFPVSFSFDGLPTLPLKIPSKNQRLLLEIALSKLDEFKFKKPKTLIITKLTQTAEIPDIKEVYSRISSYLKNFNNLTVIANWHDLVLRKILFEQQIPTIFYGSDMDNCQVRLSETRQTFASTIFGLNYGVERVTVRLKNLGRNGLEAALAAACLGINSGLSLLVVKKGLEKIIVLDRRLELLEGIAGSLILDDSYDNSYSGIEDALNLLNNSLARKRIVVLGEIKNQGEFSEKLHRRIAQKIYNEKCADYVILGGGEAKFIADELSSLGFTGRVEADLSHSQIVGRILTVAGNGDLILVKGAKASKFDEIVKRIKKLK